MADHRLVMITGSGPGAGKTTLSSRLHAEFEARHITARLWPETALFEWGTLAELADSFRRRDYPGPGDLVSSLMRVLTRSSDANLTWIHDWSWIDLAEDLPWAANDLDALDAFSRRAHAAVAHLRPLVLYLNADIAVALRRAVEQRGEGWLSRRGTFDAVAASYVSREKRIRHALDAGGWPTFQIHSHSDADRVFTDTVVALGLPARDSTV